jgi:hypothetical protein
VGELGEFLPLFFGCVLAVLTGPRPSPARLRAALALCVVLGPMASLINGEIGERSFFVVFDVAQVFLAFALVELGLTRLHPARPRG